MPAAKRFAIGLLLLASAGALGCLGYGNASQVCSVEEARGVCFHVIAHRGASAYAPENTMVSFRRAIELGANEIEMDVQLSVDAVPILFHDGTLDEKTNLSGAVAEHPAAALLAADIGSWFDVARGNGKEHFAGTPLARLDEALEAYGNKVHYHIELKSHEPELPALVIGELRRFGLLENATLTSFDFAQIERVRELSATTPICWLLRSALPKDERRGAALEREQRDQIQSAKAAGFQMVAIRENQLHAAMVDFAHEQGLQLRAFGIKDEAAMERAIAAGAQGMTIDWPDRLLERMR